MQVLGEIMQYVMGFALSHSADQKYRKASQSEVTAIDSFIAFGESIAKFSQECPPEMRPAVESKLCILFLYLLLRLLHFSVLASFFLSLIFGVCFLLLLPQLQ